MPVRLLVTAALVLCACAPSSPAPPPVLATAIPKTLLATDRGWFFQKSLLSTPFNLKLEGDIAPWASPIMAPVHVRLELQENWLVAYRVNNGFSSGPDSEALPSTNQIEFSFPVRHLDVVANQLVDSPYRPWYERSHVVVDWAHPAIEPLGWVDLKPQDTAERWLVWDPADPDRPIFEKGHLDVVVKERMTTARLETYGMDEDFWCQDRDQPNCSGNEVATRLVLMEATPPEHYEPIEVLDTFSQSTFPMFKVAQRYYSDEYGLTDFAKRSLAIRFDTYVRSKEDDGARIPTYLRELARRPVYLSPNWPRGADDTLVPSVREAFDRWNVALRTAVAGRRAIDCQRAGRGDCAALLAGDATWSYFVICETNPVTAEEADRQPLCGPVGKRVRIGNLYDYYLFWDEQPYQRAPQAFAYNNQDFGTGLNLGALISMNGPIADRTAMFVLDAIRLLNGDAAFREAYRSGEATYQWVRDRRLLSNTEFNYGNALTAAYQTAAQGSTVAPSPPRAMTPEEVQTALRRPDFSWLWHPGALKRAPDWRTFDVDAFLKPLVDRLAAEASVQQARRDALKGTALERALVTREDVVLSGRAPDAALSDADLDALSPLRAPVWERAEAQRPACERYASPFFFDPDLADYADRFRGMDLMTAHRELRRELITWVLTHEIGHTLGLRHNFAGSFDAFNYADEYWRLRSDGSAGPRYRDPPTPAERDGHIERYSLASVMDYTPNFFYALDSIGKADAAAIKYMYGGLVEVLDGPKNRQPEIAAMANQLVSLDRALASPPPLIAPPGNTGRISIHYSELPQYFDLAARSDVPVEDLTNAYGNPEVIPGMGATATADGRVLVPYMGCSDDRGARMGCMREDNGADPYEVTTFSIRRARGYYLFTHFRRGLLGFPDRRSMIDLGTSEDLRQAIGAATFVNALFGGDPAATAPGEGLETAVIALDEAFDYLGELLSMPDVGGYDLAPDALGTSTRYFPSGAASPALTLDYNEARYFQPGYYTPAEYVGYLAPELSRLGFVTNKQGALDLAITSGQLGASFGFTNQSDTRLTLVSAYRFFQGQVNEWFGAMVTDEWDAFAPGWNPVGQTLVRPSWSAGTTAGAATRVDPAFPIALKLRLLTTGIPSLYTSAPTRNFADLARIWVSGSGAQVSGVPTVTFVDAYSGKRYEAISFLTGGVEQGVGARMLLKATALQQRVQSSPTDVYARAALEELRLLIETARLVVEKVERG